MPNTWSGPKMLAVRTPAALAVGLAALSRRYPRAPTRCPSVG
jgi:hypothetical protein